MLIDGREFRLIMGSDLDRDGMFLELEEVGGEGAPLAYVFFSDGDGSFALTVYDDAAPPAAIAWLESEARRLLPLKPDAV